MKGIIERAIEYFNTIDSSLEELSHLAEGEITSLPSWAITCRHVAIGYTPSGRICIMKVVPNIPGDGNKIEALEIADQETLEKLISPMDWLSKTFGDSFKSPTIERLEALSEDHFEVIGDLLILPQDENPLGHSASLNFMLATGGAAKLHEYLSVENAKKEALEFWNARNQPSPTKKKNYILETSRILEKLSAIIKRKSWKERKVHRFINEHRRLLLPSHSECYYEHKFSFGDEVRIADFILRREDGLPALMIELESPNHEVFTKKGEPMQSINHGGFQIHEWDMMIRRDPFRNASGEFEFLVEKRNKLVVAGRRSDRHSKILDKNFGDLTIWTYEDFIDQAKERLNNDYASNCKLLGLPESRPF